MATLFGHDADGVERMAKRRGDVAKLMTADYSLDFSTVDFRKQPELYRIGKGEQEVLLREPYKVNTASLEIENASASSQLSQSNL